MCLVQRLGADQYLNEDKIPKNLNEIIDDANYWAHEFEKAGEIRDLHEEFLNTYAADWGTMTEDQRKEALNTYAKNIGKIMGNGKSIASRIRCYTPANSYEQGRHIPFPIVDGHKVCISNEHLKSASLKEILNTVTHECRHRQQSVETNIILGSNNERENEWKEGFRDYFRGFINKKYKMDYWNNAIEIDARAFAGLSS